MFNVDKRIALQWLDHLQKQTERFIQELSADTNISVSVFASRMTMYHLRAMADLADADTSEAHLIEHAAHGMSHALLQVVLWTNPPELHPPDGVAVN